jgi:hypothetical protein
MTIQNLDSIYYSNTKFDISNVTVNTFYGNFIDGILHYDNNYDIDIIEFNNELFNNNKFNLLGSIRLDNNNISFNNYVDISGYTYIRLDDNLLYLLNSNYPQIILNKINKNAYLYNLIKTNIFYNFTYYDKLYYYKLKIIINNDTILNNILGNVLYNNNNIYYFITNEDTIEIISTNIFDYKIKDYFIGTLEIITIDDIFNSKFTDMLNVSIINFKNIDIIETYNFNYNRTILGLKTWD